VPDTERIPATTREDIAAAVRRVGVGAGDVVMVHTSLSSFGRVDGGADAVIDALLEVTGPDGLVVMPTFTNCRVAPEKPESPEPYDPRSSSCRRRTGIVADTFRQRPGVERSLHPTHSLAAGGAKSAEFVSGGENRTFDPAGPYGRYARWNGKALFLGARMGSNTTNHCAEDWMGLPFLSDERVLVTTPEGSGEVVTTGHPIGCRSFYRGGGRPAQVMEEAGLVRRGSAGLAEVRCIPAREVVRVCCEHEEREPGFLLCPGTPHDFCRQALADSMAAREDTLERIALLRENGWAPAESHP
jgi:aminoglycoside 3-N-acetyltransferase